MDFRKAFAAVALSLFYAFVFVYVGFVFVLHPTFILGCIELLVLLVLLILAVRIKVFSSFSKTSTPFSNYLLLFMATNLLVVFAVCVVNPTVAVSGYGYGYNPLINVSFALGFFLIYFTYNFRRQELINRLKLIFVYGFVSIVFLVGLYVKTFVKLPFYTG